MEYETIIGLEVHSQLLTDSKMFCGCDANYHDAPPNSHVCPVCMGLPGSLPVINKKAVEYAMLIGLALDCEIPDVTKWDRKNYHYPDIPKGYQISQYDMPLTEHGYLTIETDAGDKRIGVRRAHLEEDTGRLYHVNGAALVDYNRSGVPLMEIVSEPDIRTPEEARLYLQKLRTVLRYLGVSSGDMEAGALRVDANVSVRPIDQDAFGTPIEVKNMNSFRGVKQALEYEVERQIQLLERGDTVYRETRGWVEDEGRTVFQRRKEEEEDYRYFPDPDLPQLFVEREWVERLNAGMPELPDAKIKRFQREYELPTYDAEVLAADKDVAAWYEKAVALGADSEPAIAPKTVSNWVTGDLFRISSDTGRSLDELGVSQEYLIELIGLVEQSEITANVGKNVLDEVIETGKAPAMIVEERGLKQISDEDRLTGIVDEVLDENPDEVAAYLGGREQVAKWLMGQVMRATRGKANPQMVLQLLEERLETRRE